MVDESGYAAPFPAPGSAVPGAPPALRRPLTPADGVPLSEPADEPSGAASSESAVVSGGGDVGQHAVLISAGLVGAAGGLSLQQWWSGRRSVRRRR